MPSDHQKKRAQKKKELAKVKYYQINQSWQVDVEINSFVNLQIN